MGCIFCDIVDKKIPSEYLHETAQVVAFRDVNPQAPLHALVVPKRHIATINDLQPEDGNLLAEMMGVVQSIAREAGVADKGYRLVFNVNEGGGQTVFHIHQHILAGRHLTWPPG